MNILKTTLLALAVSIAGVPVASFAAPVASVAAASAPSIFSAPKKPRAPRKPKAPRVKKTVAKRFPPQLEAIRVRMNKKGKVTDKELKRLADAGEGLASFYVAQRLEKTADAGSVGDVVHYYAQAVGQGRLMAVSPLISNVRAYGVRMPPKALDEAEKAILTAVDKKNADAALALGYFYSDGTPFGSKPEKALDMLKASARLGSEEGAFKAGLMLMNGDGVPKNEVEGRKLLTSSADMGNWAARSLLDSSAKQVAK